MGTEHWKIATYVVPAIVSVVIAIVVLMTGKGSPVSEGLPPLSEIVPDDVSIKAKDDRAPEDMTAWQIFVPMC